MNYTIDFAPHVPLAILYVLIGAAVLLVLYSAWMRAPGAWARGLAFAAALLALANPLVVHETREGLPDVAALIVDHSPSMDTRARRAEADAAAATIRKMLATDKTLEVREAYVPAPRPGDDTGTQLFAALS